MDKRGSSGGGTSDPPTPPNGTTSQAPAVDEEGRGRDRIAWPVIAGILGIAVILLVALIYSQRATVPNRGFADVAAIITLVTSAAVVIERTIEAFWMAVGAMGSGWWPMNIIANRVKALEDDANRTVLPTFDAVAQQLDALKGRADDDVLEDAAKWVRARKDELHAQRKELRRLAPNNQRVEMVANVTFQALAELETRVAKLAPTAKHAIAAAKQTTIAASDFVASFKDNPARRAVSLFAGALAGMIFTGVVGIDIFAAINGPPAGGEALTPPFWGVVATGLVIGLGSVPTHEVIKVLQEAKKKREAENSALPAEGGIAAVVNLFPAALGTPPTDSGDGRGTEPPELPMGTGARSRRGARADVFGGIGSIGDSESGRTRTGGGDQPVASPPVAQPPVAVRQEASPPPVPVVQYLIPDAPPGLQTFSLRRR